MGMNSDLNNLDTLNKAWPFKSLKIFDVTDDLFKQRLSQ